MSKETISSSFDTNSTIEQAPSIANSLDELNDAELIKKVEELETEVNHLQLENQVFENFLLKNDPFLITGMAQILELANKMQSQTQSTLTPLSMERRMTDDSIRSMTKKDSITRFATSTSIAEKGPRLAI